MDEESLVDLKDVAPPFTYGGAVIIGDGEQDDSSELSFDVHAESNSKWADGDLLTEFHIHDRESTELLVIPAGCRRSSQASDSAQRKNEIVENLGHAEASCESCTVIETGDSPLDHEIVTEVGESVGEG